MPPESRRAAREARAAAEQQQQAESSQQTKHKRRKVAGRIWIGVGIFVVVVLAAVAWVGFRALTVKNELEAAQADVAAIQAGAEMAPTLDSLAEHSAAAASAASDPIWRVLEFVPLAGDNLRAVRLAAESLDVLSNDVALPVMRDDGSGAGLLQRAVPVLDTTAPRVVQLAADVDAVVDSPWLIGQVRSGIDLVAEVMVPAGDVVSILPGMLGADGPRNYLLVFQNNAEVVGLGGSAASQSLVRVEDGSMGIAMQAGSNRFDNGNEVDVEVDQSALDLYSRYLISHVNTTVSRPDFPTAARSLTAFWQRDIDPGPIDGVVSIDPIALSRIMKAIGPVTAVGKEITADNALKALLSDAYVWWDGYTQALESDAFFASVAQQVFDRVASGDFDLKEMFSAITTSIDNGDILVYSEEPELASFLEGERIAGVLPTDNDEATTVGVYLRDTSASKIDYYMESSIAITAQCEGSTSSFQVGTGLHLNISQGDADRLPRYVQSRDWGSEKFRTEVFVYGPPGTVFKSATVEGRDVRSTRTDINDLGRPVAAFETYLAPTESATVVATFVGEGAYGPVDLWATPMIRPTSVAIDGAGCG